jgi:hypothetical protein
MGQGILPAAIQLVIASPRSMRTRNATESLYPLGNRVDQLDLFAGAKSRWSWQKVAPRVSQWCFLWKA